PENGSSVEGARRDSPDPPGPCLTEARCLSGRENLASHTTRSWPFNGPDISGEGTWQKPQWPDSMSCLHRCSMTWDPTEIRVSWEYLSVAFRMRPLSPPGGTD